MCTRVWGGRDQRRISNVLFHRSPSLIPLKHILSLNLELGMWAATPSDLLVSASHSPGVARVHETILSFLCGCRGFEPQLSSSGLHSKGSWPLSHLLFQQLGRELIHPHVPPCGCHSTSVLRANSGLTISLYQQTELREPPMETPNLSPATVEIQTLLPRTLQQSCL